MLLKYVGHWQMTWKRTILFAIIVAVYTALINQVPFLKDTSFQDIAIYLEWWILFAVFIVVNCEKWWEASLKCFVFFLISQPLIYAIEVPFVAEGWGIFRHYNYWFIVTLLTLPGAAIAFQLKRRNWLSVVVLSVATSYLTYASVSYMRSTIAHFPHHLLSSLFCLVLAISFVFLLLRATKHRFAALAVIAIVLVVSIVMTTPNDQTTIVLEDGTWTYDVEKTDVIEVTPQNDKTFDVKALKEGSTYVYFTNEDVTKTYYMTVSGGGITVNTFDDE